MTREEAIDRLTYIMSDLNEFCNESKHMSYDDREEMESLEMAIKALEKDIPKAPKKSETPRYGMGYEYYDWCCPNCGKLLAYECDTERNKKHHCICGQRLYWEGC